MFHTSTRATAGIIKGRVASRVALSFETVSEPQEHGWAKGDRSLSWNSPTSTAGIRCPRPDEHALLG